MNPVFISPKTSEKLSALTPVGTRHKVALEIALDLLGNDLPPSAVFETLRGKFDSTVSDKELHDIVAWAQSRRPTPSTSANRNGFHPAAVPKVKTPAEYAYWWLSGKTITEEQFVAMSQLPVPASVTEQTKFFLEMLYAGPDNLNIVCDYLDREGKACPKGGGKICTRDGWVDYISKKGVPQSKAGAWFRPNPCNPKGSGGGGAVTDSDVVSHRFLLLESDVLPLEKQLALFSRLKLPIALVVLSGGASAHAWVKLACASAETYVEWSRRILSALLPFGIDQANKNPSRLSRLPGARRIIGAKGDGIQKLLWINPGKDGLSESVLAAFEDSMQLPALEEKPFKQIVKDALARYQEMFEKQDNLGVPTGIADYDRDTGGLKPSQMMVISAETGAGKSSVAMNMVNAALKVGKSVALFTLEMTNEDIADLMFTMTCKIERDKFNTGKFTERDIEKLGAQSIALSDLPFWSCDDSLMTVEQMRKQVLQLKREFDIALVVVDYAQIVAPSTLDVPREQQVAAVARGLCAIAKDAKIAMVVLSQLNDEGRLRESRVIGHESHVVVYLENKENEKRIVFQVKKGRRVKKKNYVLHYEPDYCLVASESKVNEADTRWNGHKKDE